LIVDDNRDLLNFLEHLMEDAEWKIVAADSARQAEEIIAGRSPNVALLDYMLPDGNGVELARELHRKHPATQVIIMTGAQLPMEEEAICQQFGFPVLRKPFLASDIMGLIRSRLGAASQAGG
jgi:DNA-binding NtrC family response regulator